MIDEALLLPALEDLLRQLEIEIRRDSLIDRDEGFELRSGSCRVRGRDLLILDRRLPPGRRLAIYGAVLRRFDLSDRYLVPRVRAFLEGADE